MKAFTVFEAGAACSVDGVGVEILVTQTALAEFRFLHD